MPAYCIANTNSLQSGSLKQDSDVSKASGDQEKFTKQGDPEQNIKDFIFKFQLKSWSQSCEHRISQKEIVAGKFKLMSSLQFQPLNLVLPLFVRYFFSVLCIHVSKDPLSNLSQEEIVHFVMNRD